MINIYYTTNGDYLTFRKIIEYFIGRQASSQAGKHGPNIFLLVATSLAID